MADDGSQRAKTRGGGGGGGSSAGPGQMPRRSTPATARRGAPAVPVLPGVLLGGGWGATRLPPEVEGELQQLLPDPKEWGQKEQARLRGKKGQGGGGGNRDDRRASPLVELSLLLAECMQHGLRTIAFCKSRKNCELVTAYAREALAAADAPQLAERLSVYRAGYSPAERRQIESALHSGALLAVAATNALELGVDVGGLDATLHLGFPGSIASLKQQAGRAGRREQASLAIFVAFDGPLDQFFMRRPADLFGRPIEAAQVDASNRHVMLQHVLCAAAELPLAFARDATYFGASLLPSAVEELRQLSLLGRHPREPQGLHVHYVGPTDNPARQISLRAIDPEQYKIIEEDSQQVLEEIEGSKAFYEVYDGAVYLYQGRPYLCKKLDQAEKVAWVCKTDVKYYTRLSDYTIVHVTGGSLMYHPATAAAVPGAPAGAVCDGAHAGPTAPCPTSAHTLTGCPSSGVPPVPPVQPAPSQVWTSAACEDAMVTTRFLGFYRIWQGTGITFDAVDLWLPDVRMETQAAYLRVPITAAQECSASHLHFLEGVHAAAHALLNVLPLHMMCNPGDVCTECDGTDNTRARPARLLMYDAHPGGMGLAVQAALLFGRLLRDAHDLVVQCRCSCCPQGCPACVQHAGCSNYNVALSKRAAEVVLRHVIAAEAAAAPP